MKAINKRRSLEAISPLIILSWKSFGKLKLAVTTAPERVAISWNLSQQRSQTWGFVEAFDCLCWKFRCVWIEWEIGDTWVWKIFVYFWNYNRYLKRFPFLIKYLWTSISSFSEWKCTFYNDWIISERQRS